MAPTLTKTPHVVLEESDLLYPYSTPHDELLLAEVAGILFAFRKPCTSSDKKNASQKFDWGDSSGAMDCAGLAIVLATHHAAPDLVYFHPGS
jgi:hypothetical protein